MIDDMTRRAHAKTLIERKHAAHVWLTFILLPRDVCLDRMYIAFVYKQYNDWMNA